MVRHAQPRARPHRNQCRLRTWSDRSLLEERHAPADQRLTQPVWAKDYFDRFIRNQKHFDTNKHYIEMNPVAAGLCDAPEAWPFSSAGWK